MGPVALGGSKISTYCSACAPITHSDLLHHCLSSTDVSLHSLNQLVDECTGMKMISSPTLFTEKGYSMPKPGEPVDVKLEIGKKWQYSHLFHNRDTSILVLIKSGHWD